jgi:hypothetical protein
MAQSTIVRREKRVRGWFGKIVKLIFILFNVLMLIWLISSMGVVGNVYNSASSSAEQAGASIGAAIGMGFIVSIWGFGDIILGLFVLLTRGEKIIIEETT